MERIDLSTAIWRKSSHSDGGLNNCVEVADNVPDLVPVRDSKAPDGPVVVFATGTWRTFVGAVREQNAS
ncbi:DUF397 domain-containing protein [Streptomyces odontomachi]|uniref:DUF397 domain-containing protein n=1 Tax=Streptomyces odontomachi TaxID=2944940 RepID=UPI00210CB6A8|nr:DUF397 domain-containing protein [Streptomyces sp. ODS25]